MNKDNKTLKDNELINVTGGTINDGEFIQGTPFASLKEDLVTPSLKSESTDKVSVIPKYKEG